MMRFLFLFLTVLFIQCEQVQDQPKQPQERPFGIVIHGGAGTILKENMTPELEKEYRQVLAEAVEVGHSILQAGGTSQEAVEKTIHVMEDSPLFNAGKGAVLTAEGYASLDASRRRETLNAGQSGVQHIKNPITNYIAVMSNSPCDALRKGATLLQL